MFAWPLWLVPGHSEGLVEHTSKQPEVQNIFPMVNPGVMSPTAIMVAGIRICDSAVGLSLSSRK